MLKYSKSTAESNTPFSKHHIGLEMLVNNNARHLPNTAISVSNQCVLLFPPPQFILYFYMENSKLPSVDGFDFFLLLFTFSSNLKYFTQASL